VLIHKTEDEIKTLTELFTERSKPMRLMVNEDKTKYYMILLRKNYNQQNLAMNEMLFDRVNTFKYLRVELRADEDNHREIQQRINSAYKCFFALKSIFNSKLVSFEAKTILYKVMILPIVLYACETWTTTNTDEQKVAIFEIKVLRKTFGPKKDCSTGMWERRTNLELRELLSEADIVATLKSKRIS